MINIECFLSDIVSLPIPYPYRRNDEENKDEYLTTIQLKI